ncbi:putative ABC transport system permease protein [Dinghuibacter silviterrae]|uniref:Putative ABC transport system permease protein n=2 Tax=Dinghuibacter silviterrae TaxID=1539049 RepID=A0A4R8DTQ9_9BACT|nr:putative ABC transport system permease protein [Dinghuibacter silviterrae]
MWLDKPAYMLLNYCKTALRNCRKQKAFSALNLLGLTVGLATCLLITMFVASELSYDRYNKNAADIYRVNAHFRISGENLNERLSPADLGPAIVRDFSSVKAFVRFHDEGRVVVRKGNVLTTEPRTIAADSSLFGVFTLPLLEGDPRTALTQPHTVVLNRTTALKYFGRATGVVGQTLEIGDTTPYTVTGVMEDMPLLSHLHFDLIRSLCGESDSREVNWVNNDYVTYLLAKPGVTPQVIERDIALATTRYAEPILRQQMSTTFAEMAKKGDFYRYELIPLTRIHLYSELAREAEPSGSATYVRIFGLIAALILLLACVNFMNLSTARSAGRSREVGVRKVLGSHRGDLVFQFLTESVLFSLAATLLALLMAYLLLPFFNELTGQQLSFTAIPWPRLAAWVALGALFVGLLAGSYPAFFLSAFQPIQVLKGRLAKGFKGSRLRNVLVVFQFTIAIALIIGTLVIYRQLNYIRNKRLGYDREQVLLIKNTNALGEHVIAFKAAVLQLPGVTAVTIANSFPTSNQTQADLFFQDAAKTKALGPEHWFVDADYIRAMGMTMARGRAFSPSLSTDSGAVLINETTAAMLGYKNPLGEKLYKDPHTVPFYRIIGVVKDFNSGSLRQKTPPIVMTLGYDDGGMVTAIRFSTTGVSSLIDRVRTLYLAMAMQNHASFDFSFMDEDYDHLYTAETRMGTIFTIFTLLAVFVACLGLFGLVTFAAEQRTKEMSIRKVLGAGMHHIVGLLTRDFLLLIALSFLIAFPLAWWGMHRWLEGFAYRTTVSVWTFVLAGGATLAAIVVTVGYQAIKAAGRNPADSLKTE